MSGAPEQYSLNHPFDISADLEGVHNLYDQVAKDVGSGLHDVEVTAENLTSKVQLPDLQIMDANHSIQTAAAKSAPPEGPAHPSMLTEIGNVAKAVGTGALNEAQEHPLQLVTDLAIGAATGIAASAAIGALGLGAVLSSPWVLGGAAVVGVGALGAEAYTHWGQLTHNTSVVADPSEHSPQDVEQATRSAQDFGAGALQNTTKLGGAIAGGLYINAIIGAVNSIDLGAVDSINLGAAANSVGVGDAGNSAGVIAAANSPGVSEAVNSTGVVDAVNSAGATDAVNPAGVVAAVNSAGATDAVNPASVSAGAAGSSTDDTTNSFTTDDILDAIRFGKYEDSLSLREVVDFFRGTAPPIPSTDAAAGAAEISPAGTAGISAHVGASAAAAHAVITGPIRG